MPKVTERPLERTGSAGPSAPAMAGREGRRRGPVGIGATGPPSQMWLGSLPGEADLERLVVAQGVAVPVHEPVAVEPVEGGIELDATAGPERELVDAARSAAPGRGAGVGHAGPAQELV